MWKVTYVNIISEAILKWIKKQKISNYIPLFCKCITHSISLCSVIAMKEFV